MDEKERETQEGVKVTDKRRFDEDGTAKGADERKSAEDVKPVEEKKAGPEEKKEEKVLPEIDFPTFVLSLATSAQVHLGAIPNPQSGKQEQDLSLAKQTIDILGVLETKTKGNLTNEEGRLMEHVLYDLRMMYVELNKMK